MDPFSVEHICPRSRDGSDQLDNLALSCQGCNNHKATRTTAVDPESGQEAPLFHPRRDRWSNHFRWSRDQVTLIGLTPTGRATVAALALNREGVVNLRRLLTATGQHPPLTPEPSNGSP